MNNKHTYELHHPTFFSVETKRINEAVKNNPEKFPEEYVLILDKSEDQTLRSKISPPRCAGFQNTAQRGIVQKS